MPGFAQRVRDREGARVRQSVRGTIRQAFDQRAKHCESKAADGLALGHAPFLIEVAHR